jgi:NDP-sugar pyrophosphorylase family protein
MTGEYMGLQDELKDVGMRIGRFHQPKPIEEKTWNEFSDNVVVALATGGESSRFAPVTAGQPVQKGAFRLPNGDTMIEMTIRMYRDAGIKKFVALVFHNAHTTEELLGDGTSLGVEISYSYDPEQPVGRGGAVRNALENGSIPMDANLIVANPTDIILGFPGSFPRYIASAHLEGVEKGMLATPVLVPGQPYVSTGMMVADNVVVDTQAFPYIPIPAHIGVTVFSPEVLPRFKQLFSLEQKTDFEAVLFPILAKEKKLWSAGLLEGRWLQIKDPKGYKQLLEAIGEG